MIKLKNNCAELHFNYHRFALRGAEPDNGHAKHYVDYCTRENPGQAVEVASRDTFYSAAWIQEVVGFGNGDITKQTMSKPMNKTNFGFYFRENAEELNMPFPFGFVNFDLFNGFKCANNVSGRIVLSFAGDHFLLEGEFVTLPPLLVWKVSIRLVKSTAMKTSKRLLLSSLKSFVRRQI